MELFIKRYKEMKKIDINQNQDSQVNNIKKNINNNSKNKNLEEKNEENYCYICHKSGHTTDSFFFNNLRKNKTKSEENYINLKNNNNRRFRRERNKEN